MTAFTNGDYTGPAIVAFAKDDHGNVCALQAISLDAATGHKARIPTPQKTVRHFNDQPIEIQPGNSEAGVIFVAESIETALCVAKSVPEQATVWARQGVLSLKHLPVKPGQILVICAESDVSGSKTSEMISRSVQIFKDKDVAVHVIRLKQQADDFSDVLVKQWAETLIKKSPRALSGNDKKYEPQARGLEL